MDQPVHRSGNLQAYLKPVPLIDLIRSQYVCQSPILAQLKHKAVAFVLTEGTHIR